MSERHTVDVKTANNLAVRVFCDTEPAITPVPVYLFGQTEFNQESVFGKAVSLWLEGKVDFIGFMSGPPLLGEGGNICYPGGNAWLTELSKRIPASAIFTMFLIDPQRPKSNCFTEAQELVRWAKKFGRGSLYITAAPFHQVRCFISTVTVALQEYPELKVYNKVGATLDWNEQGVHSQGVLTGARKEFIDTEWDRIEKYMNLVSPKQALEYLENRD